MSALRRLLAPSFVLALGLALSGCGVGGVVEDLGGGGGPPPPTGGATAMSSGEKAYADEVLRLVNVERANAGVAPLAWDDGAERAAFAHSADMAARGYFSHTSPEGADAGDRLVFAQAGSFSGWGENIAQGQTSPARVMSDWMGSTGHRNNILRASFTHLGVGVRSANSLWWTQVFLSR